MLAFQVSPLFRQTFVEKSKNNPVLADKLDQFVKYKTASPYQMFGSNDKPFRAGGFFSNAVPKIKHAHLTHDISVVYTVEPGPKPIIRLYGLFSHDDLGTGTPSNINRQKSMAAQFARQAFGGLDVLDQTPAADTKPAEPAKKPKPAIKTAPAPKPKAPAPVSKLESTLDFADRAWEQRNLKTRWNQALTKNEKLSIINSELQYLQLVVKRNRLYPNQEQYARALIEIHGLLTNKK